MKANTEKYLLISSNKNSIIGVADNVIEKKKKVTVKKNFDCKLNLNEILNCLINPIPQGLIFYISLLSHKLQIVSGYENVTWSAGLTTLAFSYQVVNKLVKSGYFEGVIMFLRYKF